jgi:hypothetical protein
MPTVVIGNNTGDDYSGTEDCYIWVNHPDSVYSGGTIQYIHGSDERCSVLTKFTGLSGVTAPVTVSAANIYLYSLGQNKDAAVRRVLRNWVDGQATYNIYSTGNSWTTAGCLGDGSDRVATASATFTFSGTGYLDTGNISTDVQGIINGTYSNYGWLFEITETGANWEGMRHSDSSDGQRPYLTVTYTESGGTGNSYYYQQQQM